MCGKDDPTTYDEHQAEITQFVKEQRIMAFTHIHGYHHNSFLCSNPRECANSAHWFSLDGCCLATCTQFAGAAPATVTTHPSSWVRRNLDNAQYPRARGSQYEG